MLRVVRVIGILCVALAACGIGAHFSGLVSNTVTRVASFAPVLIAVGILGAVLLLICRSWVFAGIAVAFVAGFISVFRHADRRYGLAGMVLACMAALLGCCVRGASTHTPQAHMISGEPAQL